MKKLIITLGMILLGIVIVSTFIMGDTNSLKSGVKNIVDDVNSEITTFTTGN